MSSPPVHIDMDYLLFAWQDESPSNSYYLNVETGTIELVQPDLLDLDDLTDEIELNRQRYLYIPKPDRSELMSDLIDFMRTVRNPHLSNLLSVALEAPDPLAAFKSILAEAPEELRRWEDFRNSQVEERVKKWLRANSVAFETGDKAPGRTSERD